MIGVIAWWLHARHFESTDDAFIDTRIANISAQVSGTVTDLAVTDNQQVEAGAVLLKIDDRDYRTALDGATGQVEQATATVANLGDQIATQDARIARAKSQVGQAEAALTFAQQQDTRAQNLFAEQSGTKQAAQQLSSNLRQAQASLAAAQANAAAAEKQLPVLRSRRASAIGQLDEARAAEDQAKINLSRTQITAPVAGRATKISVAKGSYEIVFNRSTPFGRNFKAATLVAATRRSVSATVHPGASIACTASAASSRRVAAAQYSVAPLLVAVTT